VGIGPSGAVSPFLVLPAQPCPLAQCPRRVPPTVLRYQAAGTSSAAATVSAVSLVPPAADCQNGNPPKPQASASGYLPCTADFQILNFEAVVLRGMSAGTYKMCMLSLSSAVWSESGVAFELQSGLLSIQVNGQQQLNAYVPRVLGISLQACFSWNCVSQGVKAGGALFLTPVTGGMFCPSTVSSKDPRYLPIQSTGLVDQSTVDNAISSLPAGSYVLCFLENGSKLLAMTGLTLTIQVDVTALEVNGLLTAAGLDVMIPVSDIHNSLCLGLAL